MPLLARKKILLAKEEGTYGTDSSPSGAANAIQTSDLSITPLGGPTVNRNLDRAALGNDLQIQVGTFVQMNFMVEIAGAGGAVDDVPAWSPLLQACGFSETVNAASNVEFDPISAAIPSLTMYFHHDGQLHSMVGARGTVSLALSAGIIPKFNFQFTGLYVAPSSTADPTPDFSGFAVPLAVNDANMTTLTLGGNALNMSALDLDIGGEVVYRNIVGNESVEFVDRSPGGSVTFESPAISSKSWFEAARLSQTNALVCLHGTTLGNRVQIDAPNVQVISPQYAESDGISMISGNLSLVPGSGGNDEIKITTT